MTRLSTALAACALLCCLCASAQPFTAKVIGIVDGDTFDVLREDRPLRIRIAGIDAPESSQPWGTRAHQALARLIVGKIVTLQPQGEHRGNPQFKPRVIARVTLPDRRDLARELVSQGFAWHYTQYSRDLSLKIAETSARFGKRGLWQDAYPTPPWQWRHTRSSQ